MAAHPSCKAKFCNCATFDGSQSSETTRLIKWKAITDCFNRIFLF